MIIWIRSLLNVNYNLSAACYTISVVIRSTVPITTEHRLMWNRLPYFYCVRSDLSVWNFTVTAHSVLRTVATWTSNTKRPACSPFSLHLVTELLLKNGMCLLAHDRSRSLHALRCKLFPQDRVHALYRQIVSEEKEDFWHDYYLW